VPLAEDKTKRIVEQKVGKELTEAELQEVSGGVRQSTGAGAGKVPFSSL
jgi:bacteriocin-like protein